jgi:hypothetical protein
MNNEAYNMYNRAYYGAYYMINTAYLFGGRYVFRIPIKVTLGVRSSARNNYLGAKILLHASWNCSEIARTCSPVYIGALVPRLLGKCYGTFK